MVLRLRGGGFVAGEASINSNIENFWNRLKEYNSTVEEFNSGLEYREIKNEILMIK